MRLPILTYHQISTTRSAVSVSPGSLARQVALLKTAGYSGVPLSEALEYLNGLAAPAIRPVVITFDDGYASVFEQAAPLLTSYGWRASIFAVADYVGRDNRWPGQPSATPVAPLMGWSELRQLGDQGWEIGAHSRTHPNLTALGDADLAAELDVGRRTLQDRSSHRVCAFAYPYGRYDRRVRAAVQARFTSGCSTRMAVSGSGDDRHALARLDAWYFAPAILSPILTAPTLEVYATACRMARNGRSVMDRIGQGAVRSRRPA